MGIVMITWEDVHKIPALFEGGKKTRQEVAASLGWSVWRLDYWIKKLKASGVKVPTRSGPRPLISTDGQV